MERPARVLRDLRDLQQRRQRRQELVSVTVYGADHDDPAPRPRHVYRELVGGPLDGLLLDITGWTVMERAVGAPLRTEIGRYGRGGRALYGPRPGDARLWDWQGDTP
ncbi:hypothetical protein [Actinacidiphila soli]|uniref:hypothetical protein n=1 Tax=Actinacidiphila soli TaxID=2487275 RepID=UPI001F0C0EF7|nr:hypothetical protein [Actinacidiphila soli]